MGLLSGIIKNTNVKPADDLNTGLLEIGMSPSNLQDGTPDFVQFPAFYGVSQEELVNVPNVDILALQSAPTAFQLSNPNEMIRWHANEKKKHEVRTFIPNLAMNFVRENNPELIDQWKELGKKGFGESFTEDPKFKIPFIGSALKIADDANILLAMKRLGKDNYRDQTIQPLITFGQALTGQGIDIKPRTTTAQSQKDADEEILGNWLTSKAQSHVRGQSIGGKIGAGVSEMPGFMVEFAATGPGAAILRSAVKKSVSGLTKKLVGKKVSSIAGKAAGFTKNLVGKNVSTTVGKVAELTAEGASRTVLSPQRIGSDFTGGRLAQTKVDFTEKGFEIVNGESPMRTFFKSTASTFIEMFSESAGKHAKGIIENLIPNKVKKVFEAQFKRLNPNKKVTELWTKGGFDGFVGEMGEEELGEMMRVGFGIDTFEDYKNNKTFESYLVKAGVIGAVGSVGKIASVVLPTPRKTIDQSEKDLSGTLERNPVAPVFKEDGSIDDISTLENLPEVPKDMVRMYRAESPTVSFDDVFNRDDLKDYAPDRSGSFWSIDLDTADFFRKAYGEDAELSYVDVPKTDATNFKVNGNNIEFVLSDEVFKKGNQPIENEVVNVPGQEVVPTKPTEQEAVKTTKKEIVKEVPEVVKEVVKETTIAEQRTDADVRPQRPTLKEQPTETPKRPTRADLKEVTRPPIVSGRPIRGKVLKSTRPKTVKRIVREQTGQVDLSQRKDISVKALNKLKLSSEQRGSLKGFRAAKLETKSTLKQAQEFVNKNLPLEARGKAISALKGATDAKGLEKVISTVNKLQDEFGHREAKTKLTKTIKKISGKKANELLPEIRTQIESILDENILKKPSSKTIKSIEGLAKAVDENPFNFNREFINQTLDKVKHAAKTPIGELPTQTLIDLNDTLNMLIKLNQEKDDMRVLGKTLKFNTVTKGITKSLEKQKSLESDPEFDSEKGLFSKQWENTARPKLLVNKIDNSEDGFMTKIFHEDVDVAMELISRGNFESQKVLVDAAEKAGVKWGSKELQKWSKLDSGKTLVGRKVSANQKTYTFEMNPEEGKKHGIFRNTTRKVKLTPSEIIHLNLLLRDPGNEAKALSDGLVMEGFEKLGKTIHLSLKDVRMIENALTKQEQTFADSIFNYFQTVSKEKLIEIEAQGGRSIALVDNYFPRSVSLAKVQKFGDDLLQILQQTLSISSFRKERVKNPNPIIIRDVFQVFLEHSDQLNKDLYMRPVAKNMLAVLGNPDVSTEMTRVSGSGLARNLQERIFDVMTLSNSRFTELDALYTSFLSKWSMSKLGLRITTILKQVGGLWPAASESSTGIFKHFAKNLVNPASFKRASKRMREANATLRDRYEMNAIHLVTGTFRDKRMMLGRRGIFDFAMDPMQSMDERVSVSIFQDFENKIKAANPDMSAADVQKKAGRSAEIVIADTQNTTSIANMSKIARDSKRSTFLKSTTLFMSNAESMTNLLRTSAWRIKASKLDLSIAKKELSKAQDQHKATKEIKEEIERLEKKIVRDRKQLASTMAAVMLGNSGTSVVVNNLNRVAKVGVILLATGAGDDLEDASDVIEFLKSLPEDLALEIVGNVHLLGKLTRIINDALQGKFWWKSNLLGPLGGTASSFIEGLKLSADALKEGLGTPKGKDKTIRAIFKGAEVIATVTGAPVFVVSEIGRPIIKLNSRRSSRSSLRTRRRRRVKTKSKRRRRRQ